MLLDATRFNWARDLLNDGWSDEIIKPQFVKYGDCSLATATRGSCAVLVTLTLSFNSHSLCLIFEASYRTVDVPELNKYD